MLACKGIFTQPSIRQLCVSTKRRSRKGLLRKTFCRYYTMCTNHHLIMRSIAHGEVSALKSLETSVTALLILYHTLAVLSGNFSKNKSSPSFEGLLPALLCAARAFFFWFGHQYMPPIPGLGAAAGATGSGLSATNASVVRIMEATDAAFCNALRETLAGSTMPASIISTYVSL